MPKCLKQYYPELRPGLNAAVLATAMPYRDTDLKQPLFRATGAPRRAFAGALQIGPGLFALRPGSRCTAFPASQPLPRVDWVKIRIRAAGAPHLAGPVTWRMR